MTGGMHVPQSADEFAACLSDVTSVIDPATRLPDWPFVAPNGEVDIGQYERLLGTDFVPVLEALADTHGDDSVTLVVIEPDPSYYQAHYSHFPALRFERSALQQCFWQGLAYEPLGDPTGAVAYTANVVAVVGATRTWAVWGQRDWDLVLVHSQVSGGSWLEAGVPFVPAREALRDFTAPPGVATPLPALEITTFLQNLDERGSSR